VSLTPGRGQGGRISLILAFVFPAMIAAAMALAYYGYQGAQDVVSSQQREFRTTAGTRAQELMGGVDAQMNALVNPLFSQLAEALDDATLTPAERCAHPSVPPIVQAFAISSSDPKNDFECVGPTTIKRDVKNQFKREILQTHSRSFEWTQVPFVALKYVHTSAPNPGPILYVETKHRVADGRAYFLIAKLDFRAVRGLWLDAAMQRLCLKYRVSVVDERGNTVSDMVCGGSEPSLREVYYEDQLSRALYSLRMRVAQPEEVARAEAVRAARQRVVQILLVIMSTAIIAVGLGIVLLSVMAERRTSRLKSDFIANVSHELKTPLSLIRMFGEMVATGRHKGEEAAREYGGIITRESERLAHLIDNVLDFARLERGKASYDFAEGDLAPVIERALDVCRYRLDKEKMKLRTRIDRNLPTVRMDENALTLLILNLVDNALKYAADGGVVEVSLGRAPGCVVIGVRDWGGGIPREEQGRIFERFYRAQSARDRNVRGSGIGLSLVRHIAEAHGGRVTVDSPIPAAMGAGPGALFRVFLPAPVIAGAEVPEPEPEDARMGPAPPEPLGEPASSGSPAVPRTGAEAKS
jgi:two-component system phosphate regulon sensor histidine kinase PhoR